MKENKRYILIALGAFILGLSFNIKDHIHHNLSSTSVECSVCFTPGSQCTQKIVDRIDGARKEILVQSYSFTSIEIANALMQAHKRGIKVIIILDHSQENKPLIAQMVQAGIPTFIDKPAGIAHNKVMIIDSYLVLTGSFNFTKSAQMRNVENSVCITSKKIAEQYQTQWHKRLELSRKYDADAYLTNQTQ